MDIRFSCPACEHHMVIEEAGAGLVVKCPKCGHDAKVPDLPKPATDSESVNERTVALKWTPRPASPPDEPKK
jgi:uncharacterized Zn finger protein